MKFAAIIFLALFAVCQADLQKDFDELRELLPKEELQKLVSKHAFLDNEFIQFRKFLRTSEFSQVWDTLLANEKVQNLVTYSLTSGADIIKGINEIARILNLKSYPEVKESHIQPRTVQSFVRDAVRIVSKSEVPALMKQKMNNSSEFKTFINTFRSAEMKKLLDDMTNDATVKAQFKIMEKRGLRYKDVINAIAQVIDWAL